MSDFQVLNQFLFGFFGLESSVSADGTEAAGSSFLHGIQATSEICVFRKTDEHKTKDVYRQFLFHYSQ